MSHDDGKPRNQINSDMHVPYRRPLPTWLEVSVLLIWDPLVLFVVTSGLPNFVKVAAASAASLFSLAAVLLWRFPRTLVKEHGISLTWTNCALCSGFPMWKRIGAATTLIAAPVLFT
ncbi:MAG: hypothetical protein LBG70_04575 [Bifidobacteriaceae bacterium]|jgi:hypothetical protein|nr:hypothetical protein [Bifidobacteriaceae bacterium]